MENAVTPSHSHPADRIASREFLIDPATKAIQPLTDNLTVSQRSHNSDRFVFIIPCTVIDGHDMSACNSVMIHFENISQDLTHRNADAYKVEDLDVKDGRVTLSWTIEDVATQYAGSLIFSIHFACTAKDGTVVYNFPTLTFARVVIGKTVWNSRTISEKYPDIIARFDRRIAAFENGSYIHAVDDGAGNVVITMTANLSVVDDGDGNVAIQKEDL